MSRPLAQLLPPDLPAGATSPQFGASGLAGSGPQGGQLTSMTNLKSLLQLPIKADQRGPKDCCEMKGECVHVRVGVKGGLWDCVREMGWGWGGVYGHESAQRRMPGCHIEEHLAARTHKHSITASTTLTALFTAAGSASVCPFEISATALCSLNNEVLQTQHNVKLDWNKNQGGWLILI